MPLWLLLFSSSLLSRASASGIAVGCPSMSCPLILCAVLIYLSNRLAEWQFGTASIAYQH